MKPVARLSGGQVVLEPRKGGARVLDPLEAIYLLTEGRVHLSGFTSSDLFHLMGDKWQGVHLPAIVAAYIFLRKRGHSIVVDEKGHFVSRSGSWSAICVRETDSVSDTDLLAFAGSGGTDAESYVIVVDDEGDLTPYLLESVSPAGEAPLLNGETLPVEIVTGGRAGWFVADQDVAKRLHQWQYMGRLMEFGLLLAPYEVYYLICRKAVRRMNGEPLEPGTSTSLTKRSVAAGDHETAEEGESSSWRNVVYSDLRMRGLYVRSGFKYGGDFRAYSQHPDKEHAPYVIRACPSGWRDIYTYLAASVRVAHGVKKKLLMALDAGDGSVAYVSVERCAPGPPLR